METDCNSDEEIVILDSSESDVDFEFEECNRQNIRIKLDDITKNGVFLENQNNQEDLDTYNKQNKLQADFVSNSSNSSNIPPKIIKNDLKSEETSLQQLKLKNIPTVEILGIEKFSVRKYNPDKGLENHKKSDKTELENDSDSDILILDSSESDVNFKLEEYKNINNTLVFNLKSDCRLNFKTSTQENYDSDIFSKENKLDYLNHVKMNTFKAENGEKIKSHNVIPLSSKNSLSDEISQSDINTNAFDNIDNKFEACESDSSVDCKKISFDEKTSESNDTSHQSSFLDTKTSTDDTKQEGSKNEVVIPDYLEDEKEDISHPGWEVIKTLSTNEERYKQVRECWNSKTIPDPNKNLTYHSYRKRLFKNDPSNKQIIKQHKRHASSSLPGKCAKRSCTYFLDREIDNITKTKDQKMKKTFDETYYKVNNLKCQYAQNLNSQLKNRVAVLGEYNKIAHEHTAPFKHKINALYERRNEVLKFFSFYKGLNDFSKEDPTFLTESQFQELHEIENIYEQFNYYYGKAN